jgi:hypothetical protein
VSGWEFVVIVSTLSTEPSGLEPDMPADFYGGGALGVVSAAAL